MADKQEKLTETDALVILAMADGYTKLQAVGDKLHCTRQKISYRIDRIQRITGLNPKGFFDLLKLIPIAENVLEGGAK